MSEKKNTAPATEGKALKEPKAPRHSVNIDPQYLSKLTVTLLIICAVVAGLLGIVNSVTAPIIENAKWEKTMAAMSQVLEADEFKQLEDVQLPDKAKAVYEGTVGGETVGYAVEVAPNGFKGAISMVVGVDPDGLVTGVSIVDHSETSNIGTKVVEAPEVLARFVGMTGEITVNKGDNKFDAVSGATVSSRGVTAGVNAAIAAVKALQ